MFKEVTYEDFFDTKIFSKDKPTLKVSLLINILVY